MALTHLKVQKMVFFLHCWSLTLHGRSMVSEPPEAWPLGPVFASLYHQLKEHGSQPVPYMLAMSEVTGKRDHLIPSERDALFWDTFHQLWKQYGKLTDVQLSSIANQDGTPWDLARKANKGFLDDDQIKAHCQAQLNNAKAHLSNVVDFCTRKALTPADA